MAPLDGSVLWVKSSNVPRATQASANQLFNDRCTNATASGTMRQVSGEPRTMWQQEALRRYIKDHRDTPAFADSTVFLSDPRRERELDERLLRGLWPGVRDAVEPGLWTLLVGAEAGMSARDGLTTPRHADISRALTFLIEDPDRPRMPGAAPPWFCRGTLSCASDRFFVAFDFTPQPADRLPVPGDPTAPLGAAPGRLPAGAPVRSRRVGRERPHPRARPHVGTRRWAVGRPCGFRGGAGRHGEERARDQRRSPPRTRFRGRGRVRPSLRAPDGRPMSRSRPTPASRRSVAGARADVDGILRLGRHCQNKLPGSLKPAIADY